MNLHRPLNLVPVRRHLKDLLFKQVTGHRMYTGQMSLAAVSIIADIDRKRH